MIVSYTASAALSPTVIFFLHLQKEYGKKNRPKRGTQCPSLETSLGAEKETVLCHIISD